MRVRLFSILLACLSIAVSAVAQNAATAQSEIKAGVAALQQGRFHEAEAQLAAALKASPSQPEVLADLGLAYYGDHRYDDAAREFRLALKQNPSLETPKLLLPLSLAAANRCTEAEPGLRMAFASAPNAKMRRVLGLSLDRCLIQTGKSMEADRVTQNLLQQFPNDPDVLYEAGQFYGKLSSSIYLKLIHTAPYSARAYQVEASVAASDGNWKEAIQVYRQALQRDPALQGAHLQIAILQLTHSPDPNAWVQALQELQAELRVNPGSAEAEYEIGEVYRKHGQIQKAIPALDRSLQLDPAAVPARISLAQALRDAGHKQAAVNALKPAETSDPDDPSVHYLLARIYYELGEKSLAEHEQAMFQHLQKQAPAPVEDH